jgi:predicted NBD/HSP70 family sugar kinase
MSDHVLGADLGGSNLRVALGDHSGHTVADVIAPTARGDAQAVLPLDVAV